MVNKLSKKDISNNSEVYLLSKGSTEEMLMEFADQMFHENIHDPLAGIHQEDHAGFALEMEDGLEFMHIRSKIPDDITLVRKSHENKERIAIYFFYGSTFDYHVENKMERSVEGLINGIIIHNYSSNVRLSLLKDHEFNFVVIRLTKITLEKHFKSIAGNLDEILFSSRPLLIYENLDQNVLDHLKSVGNIQSTKVASRYLIFGKSIELLALTFELLLTRSHESKNKVRIHQYDQIVKAKNYLISNWQNPPSIKALSQYMGMCPTKAKMLFKQVYGYPPHQYFKKKKLEAAYQMIRETDCDMSEIGQKLGYKNLSHFSADFKKYYGVLPKKYSMQISESGSGN
jgi:AraC-like DNA-binding protein